MLSGVRENWKEGESSSRHLMPACPVPAMARLLTQFFAAAVLRQKGQSTRCK